MSKGIGKAIGKKLLQKGFHVIGTARNPEKIKDPLEGAHYLPLDLSNQKSVDNLIQSIQEKPIDILINNAGQSQIGPVEEMDIDKYRYLFEVNFFGMIQLTQAVLPQMRSRKNGCIINIGSLAGRFALPYQSSYCSTKFAVSGFTQSLRSEMKDFGVKVALIEPNDIGTEITPELNCPESSAYFPLLSKVYQQINSNMGKAESPDVIVTAVLKAIEKENPAPIYVAGGNAGLLKLAQRLLPDRIAEKIIRKTYELG
ncbi:SDR family oxidoreductase [Algivirga pacifica]|uniref:SDR family oxidoreductase n=2 Tax=Algivirga pacifica TaxID=1162670 RepID=A0ABP9DMK7_9BACT